MVKVCMWPGRWATQHYIQSFLYIGTARALAPLLPYHIQLERKVIVLHYKTASVALRMPFPLPHPRPLN